MVCYVAIWFKNYMKWDDALDVWGVHGVGGVLGSLALGIFAEKAFNSSGADGLLSGNPHFFGVQAVAVGIAVIWAFAFTYVMLWIINRITPVRVSSSVEEMGLDAAIHGETAYLEEAMHDEEAPERKKKSR
jgi:Amt family ammonium transporter